MDIIHKYKEIINECSLCGLSGSITRVLSTPLRRAHNSSKRTPLTIKEFISQSKEELKKDKKALQKRKK
jgi:hypothetical protein